jgi:YVTN family beta-propeller protein
VVDYQKKETVATIPVGQKPTYSTMSPDGRFVYVVNGTDGNVMKLDTTTNQILGRIAVGVEPAAAVVLTLPSRVPRAIAYVALPAWLLVIIGGIRIWRRRTAAPLRREAARGPAGT